MSEGTVTGGESGDARLWQTLGRIEQQGKTSAAQISELYKRQREVDQTIALVAPRHVVEV